MSLIRKNLHDIFSNSSKAENQNQPIWKVWASIIDDLIIGALAVANVLFVIAFPDNTFWLVIFSLAFLVEYLLKIWAASYKFSKAKLIAYAFSGGRLLDFLVTVPPLIIFAWVSLGGDIDGLKLALIARLLCIFRVVKLGRAFEFSEKLFVQVRKIWPYLIAAYLILFCVALIAGSLAFYFEGDAQPDKFGSLGDSLWWAIVTLSTVGYGDLFPITPPGRLVGALTIAAGIAFYGIPISLMGGAVTAALMAEVNLVEERLEKIESLLISLQTQQQNSKS